MPSTATITSFYTFIAADKARSSEVNYNFGNFRGHYFPVDPTATAGANNAYDLGSTEWRWLSGYAANLDVSITTTVSMVIVGLSSGGMSFRKNGTEMFGIVDEGIKGAPSASRPTGTAPVVGGIAGRSITTVTLTSAGFIAGSTCTLISTGRPVVVCLLPSVNTNISFVEAFRNSGTTTIDNLAEMSIVRNGSNFPPFALGNVRNTTTVTVVTAGVKVPPGSFWLLDFPGVGTFTYSMYVNSLQTDGGLTLSNCKVFAWEL